MTQRVGNAESNEKEASIESLHLASDLSRLSLNQLVYFIAACNAGSFRRAAIELNIQQSTVSRAVRELEDSLGASLLHRLSHGVRPTEAGKRFHKRARAIVRDVQLACREVSAIGRSECGTVRVGFFSSLASGFLADLLKVYDFAHKGVRIDLLNGNPQDHVVAIRQMSMDVAFVSGERLWDGCEACPLWSERVYLVLPTSHELAEKCEISWSDVTDERFIVSDSAPGPEITDYLVQRLAGFSHHPEVDTLCVGRDDLFALVAVGRGLTVTSEAMTVAKLPGLTYRPITGERVPFCAVWLRENDNPALRKFLSVARSMARTAEAAHDPV
ncbi:LysR family transcriptional regulator [Salipiger mucosus]|uniref:LysR family transcriptional regulator n=1 Tax=Salipiger mucosus TaxID=263378 RepID=UPI000A027DAF|nr:LysR family transcriptional regulator [Salipiger mucosus]